MVTNKKRLGVGLAHSKLILIGEHSVVYEKPAIAIPFESVCSDVQIEQSSGPVTLVSHFYNGTLEELPEKLLGLKHVIKAACANVNQPVKDFTIQLRSTIPIGRGLGSSASIAASIARGIFDYFEEELSLPVLRELVDVSETYAHGTPSGIDREAVIIDEPIWFVKNQQVEPIELKEPLNIIVADTGRIGDTHAAVSSVKKRLIDKPQETKKILNQLETLTRDARDRLKQGDIAALGEILTSAHRHLTSLGVSDDGLNRYVEISLNSGAVGAKLTGGGRGGCMFALADSVESAQKVEQVLIEAGAKETWYIQLTNGVKTDEKNSTCTHEYRSY
ncbi:mevalonate kinase [Halolactibacillus alkaliphilus]|uniref:mevalonate kinase n=1 Tax=Halolactibacillus alkaliphilus TaxID=442899 RepID=A0A511X032_9BACI|nr:mevalonate kinase [Halolactibacillus alkaliphilus]GEN56306.1 mevalonate kinase [Halolactibacillus alkaliphilus]GGN67753.1 mevalonate kinase [Halolactibacillus alkaliphilus]SFO79213.1 mevalonate kinase [Halolactibacillus alkaliphilus]